jgi:branched-chain amino acid transport system ATP-binding protein
LLRLENVAGGYEQELVVREISLRVPEASVVALLGPNGAGKSTLLRLISGLLQPRAGTIDLANEDVTALRPFQRAQRGLCHIVEGRGIFPSLTVRENLLVSAPTMKSGEIIEGADRAFPVLARRLDQIAGTLSGGEQQMLALTRAYLANPKVILVDEVSLGLAPMLVSTIYEFLESVAQRGTSLLLVEQYVSRALSLASRVYVLSRGRIVMDCAPDEIDEQEIMSKYLGTSV